ncbi:MAG: DUF167 domain-containing protein [candidate division WOR-3 bacterium]
MVARFIVKVIPGSKKYSVVFDASKEIFVISVKEKAIENRANRDLVQYLEKKLNLSPGKVRVISGFREPRKVLEILEDIDLNEVKRRLLR